MKKKDSEEGVTDVAALMAERQQYEAWLEALDTRRDSTAAHVFARVRADYEERLQRVVERLSAHRSDLEQRVSALGAELSSLDATEQARRDERAELELRAAVGELSQGEFEKAAADCDREIAKIVAKRDGVQEEAERTRSFLEAAIRPPTPTAPQRSVAAAPAPRTSGATAMPQAAERSRPSGFDELAFLQTVVGADGQTGASAPPASQSSVAAPVQASAPPPPIAPAPPRHGRERPVVSEKTDAGAGSAEQLAFADEKPPLISKPRRSSKPDWIADEPLQSLTSTGSSDIVHDDDAPPLGGEKSPFAGNVTGNNPIVLRPSSPVEHAKTLKCSECGALNYPTEWYCERCGAELAAL